MCSTWLQIFAPYCESRGRKKGRGISPGSGPAAAGSNKAAQCVRPHRVSKRQNRLVTQRAVAIRALGMATAR
jgi:hypothetical protein